MPYAWQYVKPNEGTVAPHWAHPLWRRCLHATCAGTIRGQRQLGTPVGSEAHGRFTSQRSTIFTSGGFNPNGVNWQRWAGGGRGFDNGDGVNSLNPEGWDGTAQNYYALSQAGFTGAVIIRPDAFSTNGQLPFYKHRAQPYGATEAGWSFTGAAGNLWRFNYSDGVTQHTVTGGPQDPNFTRPDLVVARLNTANTQLELWINGVFTSVSAFAATPVGNPATTEDVKILGYGPLNEVYPGFITFAAFWDRPLSNGELAMLATDPFIMWRRQAGVFPGRDEIGLVARMPAEGPQMMRAPLLAGIGAGLGAGPSSNCCGCCSPAASLLF